MVIKMFLTIDCESAYRAPVRHARLCLIHAAAARWEYIDKDSSYIERVIVMVMNGRTKDPSIFDTKLIFFRELCLL